MPPPTTRARAPLGSVGLVVGATVGAAVQTSGSTSPAVNGPLLAPGIGAQGAAAADLLRVFGAALPAVLASSSREVLGAGPDAAALRDAARRTAGTDGRGDRRGAVSGRRTGGAIALDDPGVRTR